MCESLRIKIWMIDKIFVTLQVVVGISLLQHG